MPSSISPLRFALVLPFIDNQVESRVAPMMARWKNPSYVPCDRAIDVSTPAVTLYFLSPWNDTSHHTREALQLAWQRLSPAARECFTGGMQIVHAAVPEPLASRHPDGPCEQFRAAFRVFQGKADYFYMMEPDQLPIRARWLAHIAGELPSPAEVANSQHFWIRGSVSRCSGQYGSIAERNDWHINGGSIYRVGDASFMDFLGRVSNYYPPFSAPGVGAGGCATGYGHENGHDHAIYQYLRQRRNSDYARGVLHRFSYTGTIINLCEELYDEQDIRSRYPEAYLVHSKTPFWSASLNKAREIYWRTLGRYPDKEKELSQLTKHLEKEKSLWQFPLYTFGEPGLRGIQLELCMSQEYLSRVQLNLIEEACTEFCVTLGQNKEQLAGGQRRFKGPGLLAASVDPDESVCKQASQRAIWATRVPAGTPYVWVNDFHVSPVACYHPLLAELGVELHAEIDFNNCIHHPQFCKSRLKVLSYDDWRGFSLDPCPSKLRHEFFEAYRNDEEFRRVDLFICSHPAANCELFMPFNKTMLVYATTRIEFGRNDPNIPWRRPYITERSPQRWVEWIRNLKLIASSGDGNLIAANNRYDVAFIKYHTGIDALYLPSWCEPNDGKTYTGNNQTVLLGPYRDNLDPLFRDAESWSHPILAGLTRAVKLSRSPIIFKRIHELYPSSYTWEQLLQHRAMVLIPYQVSTMFFFEIYRMNVPIFVPSLQLLVSWVREYGILWERLYGTPERLPHSRMDEDPMPSPYANDTESLSFWLNHSDYYVFPHVQRFDSWEHLLNIIITTDLAVVSAQMRTYNMIERGRQLKTWDRITKAAHAAGERSRASRRAGWAETFDTAMRRQWGIDAPGPDPPATGCQGSAKTTELGVTCPDSTKPPFSIVNEVTNAYWQVLARQPDPGGLQIYACSGPARQSLSALTEYLQQALCTSDEYSGLKRINIPAICRPLCDKIPEFRDKNLVACK